MIPGEVRVPLSFLPLWWLAIFGGSLGWGRWLLRRLKLSPMPAYAEMPLALGLGLALLSYLVFAAAALAILSVPLLLGLAALWLPAAGWALFPAWQRPAGAASGHRGWSIAVAAILSLVMACNLIPALTPAVDWDGLAYHLALPKIYLAAGGFVFRPDIFHNLFPQFTEMLFLLGLPFPDGVAAKTIHVGFGLLTAAGVYAACRESGLHLGAWLGAAIVYVQFLVHIESGTAFIDLATAAGAALALVAFLRALRPGASLRWLYLALLFAGISAATKWHGLIVLALVWLLAVSEIVRRNGTTGQKLRQACLAGAWGILPVAPYLLRAWLLGGNPVWPLAFSLLGGRDWNVDAAARVTRLVREFAGVGHGWVALLRLPYDLVVHGERFGVGGFELRWPLLGLGVLGLGWWTLTPRAPAAFVAKLRAAGLAVAAALFIVIWFRSSPQVRFLLPLFPVAAWLAARSLAGLWRSPRPPAKILAVAGGLLLIAVHPPVHRDTGYHLKTLLGRVPRVEFLTRYLPHYPACAFLNRAAVPGDKVLLFGENRGFYLDVPYLWGDPTLQVVVDYAALRTADDLGRRLETLGVRWLLVRTDLYPSAYLSPHSRTLVDDLAAARGLLRFEHAGVRVVELMHGPVRTKKTTTGNDFAIMNARVHNGPPAPEGGAAWPTNPR